jgi:putative ubiquitin-RnfH superfamily antitoxin RatB of RatAB toxin-antitoxin module
MSEMISVEVAYALPNKQRIERVEVPEGSTAIEAVKVSGIDRHFEELDLAGDLALGIFGKTVPEKQVLQPGDRVEIYRPLLIDPKEVRKRRAEEAKQRRAEGDA